MCIFGPGGEHLHTVDVHGGDGPLHHLTWLDDSSVLACCGSEAMVWRVEQEHCEEAGAFATDPAAAITQLAASPDGRYLAAACNNGTVRGVLAGGVSGRGQGGQGFGRGGAGAWEAVVAEACGQGLGGRAVMLAKSIARCLHYVVEVECPAP